MKYRIHADLIFDADSENDAKDVFALIKKLKGKLKTIKKGEPDEENSYAWIEKCYHDETPPRPCEILEVA